MGKNGYSNSNNSSLVYWASSGCWYCHVLLVPRSLVTVPHDCYLTASVDETLHPETPPQSHLDGVQK